MTDWLLILLTLRKLFFFFGKTGTESYYCFVCINFFCMRQTNTQLRYDYFWVVMLYHWIFDF